MGPEFPTWPPPFNEKRYKEEVAKRVFLFALLLAAVILAASWSSAERLSFEPAALVERLGQAREARWLWPWFLLLFGATTLLAPAFVFFITAGALWGFWPGCAVGWLAANLWSHLHFLTGRVLGRSWVDGWFHGPRLARARRELDEGGALAIAIVRQLPLPFVGVNLAAGASPLRWTRWSLGNAVGLAPASVIYSWSAAGILAGVEGARADAALRLAGAAVAVIALGVSSRVAVRWADRRAAGAS
jgi:uncharacterized membrane protein YdjX (TVP38/TMEM64 family)